MTIIERIKLAIKWLIGSGVAKNQKEIGYLLGYKNESSFSQVINGKVPLPNDFIDRLSNLSTTLNQTWLLTGEGEMLRNDSISQITPQETNSDPTTITLSKDILEQVLLNLSETLKSQQEAILNQQITIQKFTTQSLTRQGASGAPEGNVTDASVSGSDLKK